MEYEQTCFFSGHRRLPEDPRLLPALEDAIRRASGAGCRRFLCGGALGFDTLAAQTLLRLREQEKLRLCLVLPCRGPERAWPRRTRRPTGRFSARRTSGSFCRGTTPLAVCSAGTG